MITRTRNRFRTAAIATAAAALLAISGTALAAPPGDRPSSAANPQLEKLDRGLVAAVTNEGVFLSWRLLAEEVTGRTDAGLRGPAFRVYRDRRVIATVTDSTNFLDRTGTGTAAYRVVPVVGGRERGASDTVRPWSTNYVDLPLQKPARRRHPTRRGVHLRRQRHERRRRRRRRHVRVRGEVGPVELQGRLPGRLHRTGLPRHLPRRRHPAAPDRPRGEHPRRRALHPVHGLRLRRRRPLGDDAEDRARAPRRSATTGSAT